MINRFIAKGQLTECRIDVNPNSIKSKFVLNVGDSDITCHYSPNREYNKQQCIDLINLIPSLFPKYEGVATTRFGKLAMEQGETYLFISGTIGLGYDGTPIFFAQYVGLSSNNDVSLKIDLQGIFLNDNRFLNVSNNRPLVFNICGEPSSTIDTLSLDWECGCTQCGDTIIPTSVSFNILTHNKGKETMSQNEIAQWLLEWEITKKAEK